MLEQEVRFYEEHRSEWAREHPCSFVLVKGAALVGVFPTLEDALVEGARRFGLESFLARSTDQPEAAVSIPAMAAGVLHADPPRTVRG
jgi:hypothetical protein